MSFNQWEDSMESVKIKKAGLENVAELVKVFRVSRNEALPYLPKLHSVEEDKSYFTNKVLENDKVYIAYIEDTNELIGFVAFTNDSVNHLYLFPKAQGRGTGTQLLNIAKKNTDSLKLWTFQKNTSAQQFYLNRGFKIIKETEGSGNEEREPDVQMEWIREN